MTTTAPRVTPMGTLRDRFLQLAERITTPLVPADYLDIIDPLRSGADLRGRVVAIHPETRDAVSLVIKPGRGWRPHTPRAVRPHRCRRRRRAPVARVLTDLSQRPGRRLHLDHGQGDPRRQGLQPPGAKCHCRQHRPTRPRRRRIHAPHRDAAEDLVPHGGQRHHPGDGHAAQPGRARRRRRGRAQRPHTRRRDLRRRTAHAGRARAESAWSRGTPTPTACSTTAELGDLVSDLTERETWACGPTGMLDALERHWNENGIA